MPKQKPLLLLVEDDALLGMTLEAALADAGFDVILAASGHKAAASLERNSNKFVGLIADIRLPALDGWTIAKRARDLAPGMPVIYMSGDNADDWPVHGVLDSHIMRKPFPLSELVKLVVQLTS